MKAQHTPGPWKLDTYGAHPEDAIGGEITGPNSEHIADLPNYGQDSGLTKARFLSNGHLIAAAPELLAALKRLVEDGDVFSYSRTERNPREQAREAIAKAEGQE